MCGAAWPGCRLPEPCLRHLSGRCGALALGPETRRAQMVGVTYSCPRGWLGKDVLACASQVFRLAQRKTHFAPQPPGFWPQPPRRRRAVQQPPQREWAGGWPPTGGLPVASKWVAFPSFPGSGGPVLPAAGCAPWLTPLQRHPLGGAHLSSGALSLAQVQDSHPLSQAGGVC